MRIPCLPLLIPAACLSLSAQGIVMVVDLRGPVTLEGPKSLKLLDELGSGATILMGANSHLTLLNLKTGEELVFQGPCKLKLDAQGRVAGKPPQRTRRLPAFQGQTRLNVRGMVQAATVLRGDGESTDLQVLPCGPVVTEALPGIRWKDCGPGSRYRFKLFNARGDLHAEYEGTATSFSLLEPRGLKEGERYTWILEAHPSNEAPVAQSGRLRLLSSGQKAMLDKARPGPEASFADRVIFAALLEELRIKDEARSLWQALSRERPEDERLRVMAAR